MPPSSVYFSYSAWCLHIGVVVIRVLLQSSFDISRIVLFAIAHNMVFCCIFSLYSLLDYSILLSFLFLSFVVTNVSRIFLCFVVIIYVVVALSLNSFDTFIFPRFSSFLVIHFLPWYKGKRNPPPSSLILYLLYKV